MANEKELALAKSVYENLSKSLEARGWRYDGNEEELQIRINFNGDDIPMNFIIQVDADKQLISLLSFLPFDIAKDKRVEASIATNFINYMLADGSFDLSLGDGTILYRMTTSYCGSLLSKDVFSNMIDVACCIVDEYNDKLAALNKGEIDIDDFIKSVAD